MIMEKHPITISLFIFSIYVYKPNFSNNYSTEWGYCIDLSNTFNQRDSAAKVPK